MPKGSLSLVQVSKQVSNDGIKYFCGKVEAKFVSIFHFPLCPAVSFYKYWAKPAGTDGLWTALWTLRHQYVVLHQDNFDFGQIYPFEEPLPWSWQFSRKCFVMKKYIIMDLRLFFLPSPVSKTTHLGTHDYAFLTYAADKNKQMINQI